MLIINERFFVSTTTNMYVLHINKPQLENWSTDTAPREARNAREYVTCRAVPNPYSRKKTEEKNVGILMPGVVHITAIRTRAGARLTISKQFNRAAAIAPTDCTRIGSHTKQLLKRC